ncbi:site-2 protease family protein [Candidatus Kuenenbacteria bacterium CG23_combo_of_CG06-09_8_20_14_all_36_9]|uniref:Site-2 protease family protein n=1 Tax=Candidatus Kuenenbacteria bacterium CG10_big_fil_rev_8_21_14_0_10_36_11 TaxID=1974618 RepID=A0A2M6WAE1_9BACT|nr:MAG: site-2 protease family protein [Candidatus Kuenenbacteria bacterium CG23_combo_of_CG06-09_8_20_14_all_36_9]PIT89782.1 MAG: site-2 protease family protein [Candidatus Kuenenbacteria bacterium CG10_big_fil_rev_8_21_14_0_10_36_11]
MSSIAFFIFLLIGAIIHEYTHGWTADQLGDPTARNAGRLTLNPVAHIDLFGTIILPILMLLSFGSAFGYAKPVPYNPYNLQNQKRDPVLIGLAGPVSNLILAIILSFVIRLMPINQFSFVLSIGVYANILLAIFNLVPIPPLDGSKLLLAFLPESNFKQNFERYGFFILIFFIFTVFQYLAPVINWIYSLLLGAV